MMNPRSLAAQKHRQLGISRIHPLFRFLLAVSLCVMPPAALAQVTGGSITGTVRGDSGSAIPGVQISIKDVTTGQVRTIQTDTSGSYSLPALPVGNYELTVSAPGFVTQVLRGITVAVGSQRVLDIHMRPGSSQTVVARNRAGRAGKSSRPETLANPSCKIHHSTDAIGPSLPLCKRASPESKPEALAAVEIRNAVLERQ